MLLQLRCVFRFSDLRIGFKGAGDIIEWREQGLGILQRTAGLERYGLAPPAVIKEESGRGIAFAQNFQALHFVAEFNGQIKGCFGVR